MSATPDDQARPPASGEDPVYIHKPSLMGAPWELRLRPEALEWRTGRHEGRIPYGRVTRVRLSFRPVTMQTRRFIAEVWSAGGPRLSIASTSWRSMVEQASQDQAYGAFVRELHRRIAAAGVTPAFDCGSPALLYWPGLAVFAGVVVGFAVLIVQCAGHRRLFGGGRGRRFFRSIRVAERHIFLAQPARPLSSRRAADRIGAERVARIACETRAAGPRGASSSALHRSRRFISRCQTAQCSSFPRRVVCARVCLCLFAPNPNEGWAERRQAHLCCCRVCETRRIRASEARRVP